MHQCASFLFLMIRLASVLRLFTPQVKHLVWSFDKKIDQCIKAHLFCFLIFLLASVFRSFTPKLKHLVWSFNKKNDQRIKAHFFICLCFFWFPHTYNTDTEHYIQSKSQSVLKISSYLFHW